MDVPAFNKQITDIVNAWCDRRDLGALSCRLLSAWLHNNGLTDGWHELADALRSAATIQSLPRAERDTLKRLWIEVDVMLRSR